MAELTPDIVLQSTTIELNAYGFIHPLAIGLLATKERNGEIKTTNRMGSVSSFLSRIGYYNYIKQGDPHRVSGSNLKTIEIRPTSEFDAVIEQIRKLLRNDPNLRTNELLLVELNANVDQYAGVEGLIVGQVIKGCIELAVVDSGVGIHASLTENPIYREVTEPEALTLSVQKGVTAGRGRGFGLWSVHEVLQQNGGKLTIGSGSHRFCLGQNPPTRCAPWRGTYVELRYNLNRTVDYSAVTGLARDYRIVGEDSDLPF